MKFPPAALITLLIVCAVRSIARADNPPPTVNLVYPHDGSRLLGTQLAIQAEASDTNGQVVSIEYFAGTNLIVTFSNAPAKFYDANGLPISVIHGVPGYDFQWNLPYGEYDLTARASDDQGASTVSASVHITMVPPPVFNIEATAAQASESGAPGVFTVRRTGAMEFGLTVLYSISGTAGNGVDYQTVAASPYFIQSGQESFQIVINPLQDSLVEGRETVILRLTTPIFITLPYVIGSNSQAYVYIADDDGGPTNHLPVVTMSSPVNGGVYSSGAPITLSASATDADGTIDRIEFLEGTNLIATLTNGIPPPWIIVIGSGLGFPFGPQWTAAPGEYDVTARAVDNDGGIGESAPCHITVIEPAIVTVQASNAWTAEPNGGVVRKPGQFTILRQGSTNLDLRVFFTLSGTATPSGDYLIPGIWWFGSPNPYPFDYPGPYSAIIPAGQNSVSLTVNPLADRIPEETESVRLTLQPYGFSLQPYVYYSPGADSSATVYIKDRDGGPQNHPPHVGILTPQNGDVFPHGSDIALSVDTLDRDTWVEQVEFFDGLNKIGKIDNSVESPARTHVPLNFIWTNPPPGTHVLRSRATDTQGGTQSSESVRIRVR